MFLLAIIGCVNVGKTSLFNLLTKTSYSLVSINNSNTRDFNYGFFLKKDNFYICVDTCNFENFNFLNKINLFVNNINYVQNKFISLINEVNLVCLLIDITIGLTSNDLMILSFLRKKNKNFVLLVNKIDLVDANLNYNFFNFYKFNIKYIFPISIRKNTGISRFYKYLLRCRLNKYNNIFIKKIFNFCVNLDFLFYKFKNIDENIFLDLFKKIKYNIKYDIEFIRIVILGKFNVGKSTLLNNFCNVKRSITSNIIGTTKDFLFCNLIKFNINYYFSDSPGLKCKQDLLKKNLLNIFSSFNIFLYLVDINDGICKYDLRVINFFLKRGKIIILIFNKCDLFKKTKIFIYKKFLKSKFSFIRNMKIFFISSLNRDNNFISSILYYIKKIYFCIFIKKIKPCVVLNVLRKINSNFCKKNNILNSVKFKYSYISNYLPFVVNVYVNKVNLLNASYKKYLTNIFIKKLDLIGLYVKIKFRGIIKYRK